MSGRPPVAEQIAQRILYSADAAALIGPVDVMPAEVTAPANTTPQADAEAGDQQQAGAWTLAVFDERLPDLDSLLADITAQAESGVQIEYLLLEAESDGLQAVTDALASSGRQYQSLQLYTHGATGSFELGNQSISDSTLAGQAEQFLSWRPLLTDNADVLIFGCDLTAGESGLALIDALSELTGADIAASADTTGHASLGGDWELEDQTGRIDSTPALSITATDSWLGTLNFGDNPRTEQVNQNTSSDQNTSDASGATQIATNGQAVVVVWEDEDDDQVYFRLYDTNGQPTSSATAIERSGDTDRINPSVAMNASGEFIVVWEAKNKQDGDKNGIYAQRFTADGTPMPRPSIALSAGESGSTYENAYEFRVSRETRDHQSTPAVAMFDNGRFIITWVQEENGGDENQIYYSTFDNLGNQELNTDQVVSANSNQGYGAPVIGINNTDQTAVIAYTRSTGGSSAALAVARLNNLGLLDAATRNENLTEHGNLQYPAIAMNDSGGIVVAWQEGASDNALYFKRLDADLNQLGSDTEFYTSYLIETHLRPSIAIDESGNIAVAWESHSNLADKDDIYVRHFNAAGEAVSSQQRISSSTHREQHTPNIVLHGDSSTVFYRGRSDADNKGVLLANSAFDPIALDLEFPAGTTTVEGGGTIEFRVALASKPSTPVVITASVSNPDEGTVNPVSRTFDNGNWQGMQAFYVQPGDDLDADGDTSYTITLSVTSTADPNYAVMPDVVVPWINRDNESNLGAVTNLLPPPAPLPENATAGTEVGITANAVDPDPGDVVTYDLTQNPYGRFAIDPNTGVVTVLSVDNIDYETDDAHPITVRATSTDGGQTQKFFLIQIADVPEPLSPITDANAADSDTIAENASAGAATGLTARSVDGDNDPVSYSLTDNAGGRFAIDSNTGEVTYTGTGSLDFEGPGSYQITVQAESSDDTKQQTFTITASDADDPIGAVTDDDPTEPNTVAENAAAGTTVGITAQANDQDAGDTVEYSLLDDAGGRFVIDSASGVVTVSGNVALDFESAPTHEIEVRATSDGAVDDFSDQRFTINLVDVNDPVSEIVDANTTGSDQIAENSSAGTTVGITASATDQDGDTVTFSLTDDANGRFVIDANSGVITASGVESIDFEAANSHNVTVQARSTDGSTSQKVFTISVTNVAESVGPVSDVDSGLNVIAENSTAGAYALITANAVDPEGDAITYTLDDDASGRFTINASTGAVLVNNGALLNFEAQAQHQITVRATSEDGSFSTATFTIDLADVNENVSSISDEDSAGNQVPETAANGTPVGVTALANDPDDGDTITYSLTSNPESRFEIADATDGTITINQTGSFTWTPGNEYTVVVRATSSDASFSERSFTITVTDVNEDVSALIDGDDSNANEIAETATANTPVGITAQATDPDVGDSITYSLSSNPSNLFKIADPLTGVVTVNDGASFDYETATEHTITIRADSTDGSYVENDFTIDIVNVNEPLNALADDNGATNSVYENAAAGTLVGITANTEDNDLGQTVTYAMESDPSGLFVIDSSTGVVSVATGAEIDYEAAGGTNHQIEIRANSTDGSTTTRFFDIDVLNVNEPLSAIADTDGDDTNNQVVENATAGTTVGITANTQDADDGQGITYTLEASSDPDFTIDANTGVVSVRSGAIVDHEASALRTITVRATSDDGSTTTESFDIEVINVNEPLSAITDIDNAGNTVAENAVAGTSVHLTARATDTDQGRSIQYSLEPVTNPLFAIDANTGIVTVNSGADLNYESSTSHQIAVRATSDDGSTALQTFTIAVTNVNEGLNPIADSNGAANVVPENATAGASTGVTAATTDIDNGRTITYTLDTNPDGLFAIDQNTGVVTVSNAPSFDFETAPSYQITVLASSSDGSTATETFTIAVGDINEAPSAANRVVTMDESTSVALTIADFPFADQDGGDTLSLVRIDSLPALGTLTLRNVPVSVNQEISVASLTAGELVYTPVVHGDGAPYTSLRFSVADSAGLFSNASATLTFDVNNTVDYSPTIISNGGGDTAPITLPNRSAAVTTVQATDPDSPNLSYGIVGGADAAAFTINAVTGALSFVVPPAADNPSDTDGDNIYEVTVSASDGGRTDTQSLRIGVDTNPDGLLASWSGNRQIMEDQTTSWAQSLSFADPLNAAVIELRLSVTSGTLSLGQTSGLNFTEGDGTADNIMHLSGSVNDIAQALQNLDYRPAPDVNGNWLAEARFTDPADPTRSVSTSTIIEIVAVNDLPTPTGSLLTSAVPGTERVLNTSVLAASDIEDESADLHFVVVSAPAQGTLLLDGVELAVGDQFSQAQLSSGAVSYLADKVTGGNDSFELEVEDSDGARSTVIKIAVESLQPAAVPDEAGETQDNESSDETETESDESDSEDESDEEADQSGRADTPAGDSNADGTAQAAIVEDSSAGSQSPIESSIQSSLLSSRRDMLPAVQTLADQQESDRRFDLPVDQLQTERSYGIDQIDFSGDFFSRQLDAIKDEIQHQTSFDRQIVTSSFALSSSLSIGYVLWLIRSGALLSSVLASMPAWRSIDPLPILNNMPVAEGGSGDDESIESMLEQARQQSVNDAPADPPPDIEPDPTRATL